MQHIGLSYFLQSYIVNYAFKWTIIIILHYSEDWIITASTDEQLHMEMIKCNSLKK